jgi:TetR/AcrR family transcriptional repressor of nem operon
MMTDIVDEPSMMSLLIIVKGRSKPACSRGRARKVRTMRLTKEQTARNRQAIVDAAEGLFRTRGFDAVTVADLMDAAGFTHGGFYNHFPSKEALAIEVTTAAMRRSNDALPHGKADLEASKLAGYVAGYLSSSHRDHPSRGCTIGALSGDAARQGKELQAAFADGIEAFLGVLTAQLLAAKGGKGKRVEAAARAEAMRLCSEMVGALVLSRAVAAADPALSDSLLEASRHGCVANLERPQGGSHA